MNQNSLFLILAAPAVAWIAGMGLFKTLLAMAVLHRWVPNGTFEGPLSALANDMIFYPIAVLAAVEIVVDLIPRWDIQWDRWNAHLRIIGAVVLSWMILYQEDVLSRVIMCLVGAALAITSFTAKTSARKAAIRSSTAAFVGPVSSVTENCMIFATLLPLTRLPPMTLLMIAFMGMASILIIYIIGAEARNTLRWIFGAPWVPVAPDKANTPSTA